MSKMGNTILDIQDLAYQGMPNAEIAKYTKTSIEFVDDVVKDYFQAEFGSDDDMEVDDGA